MPDSSSAGWDVVLPSMAPPLGKLMQDEVQYNRENEVRTQQANAQEQRRREADALANMRMLNDIPKQLNSDNLDIKAYGNTWMAEKMKELMPFAKVLSQNEMYGEIQKLTPQLQAFDMANQTYKNALKSTDEWLKERPNVDNKDAKDFVNHFFKEDFFKNVDGKLELNPDAQSRDYTTLLESDDVIKHMKVSTDPLMAFAGKIPKREISGSTLMNNKGHVVGKSWKGLKTDFSTDPFEGADGKPRIELQSEDFNGVKQAPKELMNMIDNNPSLRMAARKSYLTSKGNLDQQGLRVDPRVEDNLYRGHMWQTMNRFTPHEVNEKEKVTIPKPPRTTININNSGDSEDKNPGSTFVSDFSKAAKSGDINAIKEALGRLYVGKTAYKLGETLDGVKIKNGKLIVPSTHTWVEPQTGLEIVKPSPVVIDLNDPNLEYKAGGIWQQFTGSDAKVKRVKQTNAPQPKTGDNKSASTPFFLKK